MTVYVSMPALPLTLRFEEPFDEVATHFQEMLGASTVHRYDTADGEAVLVNYAVLPCLTIREGARAMELSELNRGIAATIR